MVKFLLLFGWLSVSCALCQSTDQTSATPAPTPTQQFPEFKGGVNAFLAFIVKNYNYPNAGETSIRFRVTATGAVNNVRILKSQGAGADKELIRVIRLTSGKWNPGKLDGKAVDMDYIQPLILTPTPPPTTTPKPTPKPKSVKR